MQDLEPDSTTVPKELCIVGEVRAETQEQASYLSSMARVYCKHAPYPHQLATAGNFAMPFSPFDIPLGQYSEFCIYHLMPVSDPSSLFPISARTIKGSNTAPSGKALPIRATTETNGTKAEHKASSTMNGIHSEPSVASALNPPASDGLVYLASLASVIRSKNAGPYELTFDIMFPDRQSYEQVKQSNILSTETICKLYNIPAEEVLVSMWWEPALAYKVTIKRPIVSSSFGETDTHGSAQHVPLMYLQIPNTRSKGA